MPHPVLLKHLAGPEMDLPPEWAETEIRGLTADSRQVKPGWLFAALSGSRTDGTRFISSAIENGTAALLIATDTPVEEYSRGGELIPAIRAAVPRRELALMASRFYGNQPKTIAAVTGTNGKTSVASFLRQIWSALGYRSASLGTIGVITDELAEKLSHTTPEPVELHERLDRLADGGITHLAIEASSHGLEQHRLDGVDLTAAAFTNISRDHLDYHSDFEDYFAQKLRLFSELLPASGAVVVDSDSDGSDRVIEIARQRKLKLLTVGKSGGTIRLVKMERDGFRQRLELNYQNRAHDISLPLVGDFQTSNALVTAGLAIATGADAEKVFQQLCNLKGASGRLEHVGTATCGAPVFVDYAHTPDALENAISALKPYAENQLIVVFGCGGDRDRGKRPMMGAVATENADKVVITDDNPRGEIPAAIRSEILATAPGAIEIGDRQQAISEAIQMLGQGDVLLIAGKGHETGQIIGERIIPFSDHDAVRLGLRQLQAGEQLDD